jgi:cell filamentation protein
MTRGTSTFAYPEHIETSLADLFTRLRSDAYLRGRSPEAFATGAASFLADLNAIHAFRDGNGRTQLTFMSLLAVRAGHPLDLERIDPPRFLDAMIASFHGQEALLVKQMEQLIA